MPYDPEVERLSREYGINLDDYSLEGSVNELAAALVPPLAAKTGRSEEDLRGSLKGLVLDHRPYIDGHVTTSDDWRTFEIGVSEGLLIFHHKMVKIFVSQVSIVGDGQKIVEATRISQEETLAIVRRLVAAFWSGEFFGTQGLSIADLTKSQIFLTGILLTYSESFVIAHEFGHMVLRTAPDRTKRERLILQGLEDTVVKPAVRRAGCADETGTLKNWMEELAADYVGANLCAALAGGPTQKSMIQAAALIALMMSEILEKGRAKVGAGDWKDETHPPAGLRAEVLQSLLDWPAGMEFGAAFRKFADHLVGGI